MTVHRAALLFAAAALAVAAGARGEETAIPPGVEPAAGADPFLAEAAPLLGGEERAIYLALERPYQRAAFARRFWELRDPYPETPGNELLERWRERLPLARERFGSLADARARVLLLAGEPAQVLRFACAELLRDGEAWVFRAADRIPEPFTLVFVAGGAEAGGGYRLWSPAEGRASLAFGAIRPRDPGGDPLGRVAQGCPRGAELAGALADAPDFDELDRRWELVRTRARSGRAPSCRSRPTPATAARRRSTRGSRSPSRTGVRAARWSTAPSGWRPPTRPHRGSTRSTARWCAARSCSRPSATASTRPPPRSTPKDGSRSASSARCVRAPTGWRCG